MLGPRLCQIFGTGRHLCFCQPVLNRGRNRRYSVGSVRAQFPRRGVAVNVENISASSEIAASSGLNVTGSATHRDPAATRVPGRRTLETSACPVAGVSKRNASARSASLGAGSSAAAAACPLL